MTGSNKKVADGRSTGMPGVKTPNQVAFLPTRAGREVQPRGEPSG